MHERGAQSQSDQTAEPEGLEVRRPSLEDIYLGLLGTHAHAATEIAATETAAAEPARGPQKKARVTR